MNIEVTSVSKKSQKLSDAAAAVFVITSEDIRCSGVTSIPEALRMAPGLQVARIDANKWAISARGFNGRFANKLLVLIDGRSVYTPLYVCIFGEDPFKQALKSIKGKRIKGKRRLKINPVRSLSDIGPCHILFIAPSERYNLSKIFTEVGSNHTLTVGDMEHFSEKGGMINLIKVDNKIKFEINLRSARKAGLKISSKILKLAKVNRNDP